MTDEPGPGEVVVWRPHYFSSYCIHELHRLCRLTCKTCGQACRCPCHQYDRR